MEKLDRHHRNRGPASTGTPARHPPERWTDISRNTQATTTLAYFNTNRLQTSTDPDGRVTTFEYDDAGRQTVVIDPDGRRTKTVYDAAGQVTQVIRAETTGLQQTYMQATYSSNGLTLTKKDARNNVTTNLYDGFDRLSRRTFADATYEDFAYDARDNRLSTLTRAGQTITTVYDTLDRVATRTVPQPGGAPAVVTTYTYDLSGRATQIADTAGHTIGYTFDTAKRVTSVSQAGPGIPSARSVSYQYDAASNRTRLTWPDGYYVSYAYDALHRLITATENGTFVLASYTYDPLSRRTGAAHGNGTSVAAAFSTGVDLLSLANNFVGSSVTHTHAYTPAHRLKNETVSSTTWRFAPAAAETISYATANNLNQYPQVTKGTNPTVTLAYDASGNLTGDGTWTFAYDAENKMTSAAKSGTSATYAYDPLLRRQGKTVNGVTTTFLLDGAEEIGDYDGAGAMLRRYVPSDATDAPIAMIEGTGGGTARKWFHRNRIGSTIAMSDGAGAVSEGPITYDPFGNSASTGGVPFKYTGRRYDTETGLYYYRMRYYSPELGRFLQNDPIGTCDNMNLYAYVDNDPMNARDPTGTEDKMTDQWIDACRSGRGCSWWQDGRRCWGNSSGGATCERRDQTFEASFSTKSGPVDNGPPERGGGDDESGSEDGESGSEEDKPKPKPRNYTNCKDYCLNDNPTVQEFQGVYDVVSAGADDVGFRYAAAVDRGAYGAAGLYYWLWLGYRAPVAVTYGSLVEIRGLCIANCMAGTGPGP